MAALAPSSTYAPIRERNFIGRNPLRTESDDFKLNVESRLDSSNEAIPVHHEGFIIGWKIQSRYA